MADAVGSSCQLSLCIGEIGNTKKCGRTNSTFLTQLNLDIRSGELTALVGGSGSGKTTITNLIYRMWDAQKGCIMIDGLDIKEFDIEYLRNNISIVSQDIALLNDTVFNNIALGDNSISLEEIKNATKTANIYDTIMNFDEQFNTIIGDRGIKLSGGQKQRLAIATAVLKKRPIIIFDEATSALDNINELKIHEKIIKLFKNQTVIVIAHRLTTIKYADKIYVMDSGSIVETGKHLELLKNKNVYYKLYNKELEDEKEINNTCVL